MAHTAQFRIDVEFIISGLHLPEDTQIYNILRHPSQPDAFIFYVTHPDLPEQPPHSAPVVCTPVFQIDDADLVPSVKMLKWGIE